MVILCKSNISKTMTVDRCDSYYTAGMASIIRTLVSICKGMKGQEITLKQRLTRPGLHGTENIVSVVL